MTTKTRVPYGRALGVANLLTAMLEPFCERIEIAGSIRRGRPDIGDVELVAVPRYYTRASTRDMFDAERMDEQVSQLKEALITWLAEGRFHNRGAFGDRNIYLVHVDSDMAVDIFITDEDNWGMMQFVRTGPADYVRRAMARFQQLGLHGKPYAGVVDEQGREIACPTEEVVYQLLKWSWLDPDKRL